MSDVADGIGGAIEGALLGGAVEPRHGEGGSHDGDGGACRNCGAEPTGHYCQNCGQKVHIHRTLTAIGHDLIHGVLHLDGKFWATLPLLIVKPGKLTRRYIEGERAKFVSPMAMFLFSVFAMFAVFQIAGITTPTTFDDQIGTEEVETSLAAAIDNNRRTLADIREDLEDVGDDAERRADLERREENVAAELQSLSQIAEIPVFGGAPEASEIDTDDTVVRASMDKTGIDWIDEGLVKKWRENPGLMLYKLQANAYKFSWLLIPLSIPFVWLTFAWRRRFGAYDHAIFVTYSLSFMSLLFIAVSLLALLPKAGTSVQTVLPDAGPLVFLILLFVPPIHLYKQLRGAYEISRFSAFWRLMVLSAAIWIVLGLFLQVLLLIGAF